MCDTDGAVINDDQADTHGLEPAPASLPSDGDDRLLPDPSSTPVGMDHFTQLEQLKNMLQEEIARREEAKSKVKGLENALAESEAERIDVRKSWKKAALEVDKLRKSGQVFYKLTDEYLVELITQLRYTIRDFALQYFDGNFQEATGVDPPVRVTHFSRIRDEIYRDRSLSRDQGSPNPSRKIYLEYLEHTTPAECSYRHYLGSGNFYKIIQAFLWNVVKGKILGHFLWMNRTTAGDFWNLRLSLRPGKSRPDPEAERKFQMWSATTTGLILDAVAVNSKEEHDDLLNLENKKARIIGYIKETIGRWSTPDNGGFNDQLSAILDKALALDREISRQVSKVEWIFAWERSANNKFNPDTMDLEKGDTIPHKDAECGLWSLLVC
ncbi:hypothetical protein BGZ61DRAFT_537247 [Ilyonectria robusta]|uniref:uncharacterized protein n=1 Tax=Ilyonectria robusta TaxID=1079257 RepID=UPI001E8D5E5F|nr:uncharacterized protein BGZ61DRAFT_537247 [Ilyonectria robusta]KAH8670596.1 hypothetical protein BGZ61DRAFT_537247 [Ilyonectria robusta]